MKKLWKQLTPSDFAWEIDALEYIRQQLPDHEPYRAWANFEFTTPEGGIYEVDLLVLTPKGFFLVEIKSHPGAIDGDAGIWRWFPDGREGRSKVFDNPRRLANSKSKKLVALLKNQRAVRQGKVPMPFLQTLVFLSAENVKCHLSGPARAGVFLRDVAAAEGKAGRQGIMHALTRLENTATDTTARRIDSPTARMISQAMEQAGIKESARSRRVGPYQLGELLDETDLYQEWSAEHTDLDGGKQFRVRIFLTYGKDPQLTLRLQKAARREYEVLQGLEHAGILQPYHFDHHDLGPALVFKHNPNAQRLDHFLLEQAGSQPLAIDTALTLLRQLAETLRYTHSKKLYHRALNPQSILVWREDDHDQSLHCKISNWSTALRIYADDSAAVSATSHISELVQEEANVYLALEAHTDRDADGVYLDIFSLGAIAYHIFTGQKPAANELELQDKLRRDNGLQVTDTLNGASKALQDLVKYATHAEPGTRIDSIDTFLEYLDKVEDELTRPDNLRIENPIEAKTGDLLPGGFRVKKRLGSGASSVTLLVERHNQPERVLKIALSPDHNSLLQAESEALQKLHHAAIVRCHDSNIRIGGHLALLVDYADQGTLAQRLRLDGAVQLELLERFGDDLLSALCQLEEKAVSHRDIKPDNIGLSEAKSSGQLHLLLFDFSLCRAPPDNLTAGTAAYLDPFIRDPERRRWDDYAERFAAALTLYEMTTGTLPGWALDDKDTPPLLQGELAIDAERFDPSLREPLAGFFRKALARRLSERFDNAEHMLRAWRQVFYGVAVVVPATVADEPESKYRPDDITPDTQIGLLQLSTLALSTLTRLNVNNAGDLLALPLNELRRMTGVGSKTRREIITRVQQLRERFADSVKPQPLNEATADDRPAVQSIDLLFREIIREKKNTGPLRPRLLNEYLGRPDQAQPPFGADTVYWPALPECAAEVGLARAEAQKILDQARRSWNNPSLTSLRNDIAELLKEAGGIISAHELAEALLLRRGSIQPHPWRQRWAQAVTRVALETENQSKEPRWLLRRCGNKIVITLDSASDGDMDYFGRGEELADYAETLGRIADECARQDPLPAPQRVLEKLRAVESEFEPLSQHRLLRLAAATSQNAALSSRAEFYPVGMEAQRALILAQGALLGARVLTIAELRDRIAGRYPLAQPLPEQPLLDQWIEALDIGLSWNADYEYQSESGTTERGAYCQPEHLASLVYGLSTRTSSGLSYEHDATAVADTQTLTRFVSEINNALEQRRFLALTVPPRYMDQASERLSTAFPQVKRISFDELLLNHMHQVCATMTKPPPWDLVLRADAAEPGSRDWLNLLRLIQRALPGMAAELRACAQPVLLSEPGLLARYDLVTSWLQTLRDELLNGSELQGLILLIAADAQQQVAVIDNVIVPTGAGSKEYARIPQAWLEQETAGSG